MGGSGGRAREVRFGGRAGRTTKLEKDSGTGCLCWLSDGTVRRWKFGGTALEQECRGRLRGHSRYLWCSSGGSPLRTGRTALRYVQWAEQWGSRLRFPTGSSHAVVDCSFFWELLFGLLLCAPPFVFAGSAENRGVEAQRKLLRRGFRQTRANEVSLVLCLWGRGFYRYVGSRILLKTESCARME